MTIKEWLHKYYAANQLFQPIMTEKLRVDLEAAAKSSPSTKIILHVMQRFKNDFHPDVLVDALDRMRIDTDLRLLQFDNFLREFGGGFWVDLLFPGLDVDLAALRKITSAELSSLTQRGTGVVPTISDNVYYMLDEVAFRKIINFFSPTPYRYVADRLDCDDFTRMFRSMLSENGMGNLSVGSIIAEGFAAGATKPINTHSFIVALVGDHLMYYDPMTHVSGSYMDVMTQNHDIVRVNVRSIEF